VSLERNKMRLLRKPRAAVSKGKPYGRHVGTVKTEEVDGRVYGIALHATKGKRRRRVYNASARLKLIGI
jgi:hypothetical protein